MTPLVQNILVAMAVSAAAAWLLVHFVRRRRRAARCDTCALADAVTGRRADAPAHPPRTPR